MIASFVGIFVLRVLTTKKCSVPIPAIHVYGNYYWLTQRCNVAYAVDFIDLENWPGAGALQILCN